MTTIAAVIVTVLVVGAGACGNGGSHASPASAVVLSQRAVLPAYGVIAMLPASWIAEDAPNTVIPADGWSLHPRASTAGGIWLTLGWLPRRGRHSAFFPGGRSEDGHAVTAMIAGAPREGLRENADRSLLVDFEVGEVAVSVVAVVPEHGASADELGPEIEAVLGALRFDPAVRPPDSTRDTRRGLELARAWATAHGKPTDNIVFTGAIDGTTQLGFTVFFARGLQPLRIEVATGVVEAPPL